MATWKKVIVSGSSANLSALQVDNLTSGSVVIGGGTAGNLSSTAINGTGNILATTGANGVSMSGSFSGSFRGNFIGTTDLPDLTQGVGITAFTYDGSTTATIAVSGASTLNTNNISKWTGAAFANSSLTDNGTTITGNTSIQLSGANSSLTGSFSGSLIGTASWATNAISALTSSRFTVTDTTTGTGPYYVVFTDGTSGAQLPRVDSATLTFNATTNTLTVTSSYAAQALSASYAFNATSASYAFNATSASYAASTNNITNAITNNTDNRVLTATGGGTINGESNLTFDGTTLTVTGNTVITSNLTVQGTASFQNTTNLEVADRFVLFASGSNTAGDGGIVIQQGVQNVGELFGYENSINRWGFTSSFNASSPSFTATAYVTTTEVGTAAPSAAPIYGGSSNGFGNMYVKTDTGDIFIYA
jgi:hypothetical protein